MPVASVTFDSLSLTAAKGIAFTDAKEVSITRSVVRPGSWPVVRLADCEEVTISDLVFAKQANPVLRVEGKRSHGIVIRGARKCDATLFLSADSSAAPDAVTITE